LTDEKKIIYGPGNPHPLSTMKTELVWEGKYDEYGRRREVDVAGCAMPMQKIETVDQPRSEAAAKGNLSLFEQKSKRQDDFRNMLVWGDNKLVMASLLKEFKGKVDLIYIDPPFDVGADFTMEVPIGDSYEAVQKDQSTLEMVAYRDTWGKGTDTYLSMMQGNVNRFASNHDSILWYSKSNKYIFEPQKEQRDRPVRQLKRVWDKETKKLVNAKDENGKVIYIESHHRTIDDVWRLSMLQPADRTENIGYATQKPESMIERIIRACSNEGDLVADLFCGSGTTGVVAERLGRQWIMADLGRFSIHTSRKRMIELQRKLHAEGKPYRAFDVYNLGRYERQWWQKERLQGADEEHRRVVLEFFRAEILMDAPSPLIHGRKGVAFCHVDGIDSLFTRDEARDVAEAVAQAGGREVYCLAWEFEMDIRLTIHALESEFGIKMKLIQIPREIMEKNRTSPPPFLEMAVLKAEPVYRNEGGKRMVDIKITQFMPSLAEVPTKELEALKERAVKSGFDFIDFWAVDFDWSPEMPFNHHWQDYRTRKDRSLKTVSDAGHVYNKPGTYTACVKVVDVFGADTSITVEVEV